MEDTIIKQEIYDSIQEEDLVQYDIPEIVDVNTLEEQLNNENRTIPPDFEGRKCSDINCDLVFTDLYELQIHEASHDPNRCCPFCSKSFTANRNFIIHLNAHLKAERYRCEYCPKTFAHKNKFILHTRVHTNERPFECRVCGKTFKQRGAMKVHERSHLDIKTNICEICNGDFATSSSLKRHIRKIHEGGKCFHCKKCDKDYYNVTAYREHRNIEHPELKYLKKCGCGEIFTTRHAYIKHRKMMHCEPKQQKKATKIVKTREYYCKFCGECFIDRNLFYAHRNSHMIVDKIDDKLQYSCKLCNKTVNTKKSLFSHMDGHLEKSFHCHLCDMNFTFSKLRQHNRLRHDPTTCELCKKIIYGKTALTQHRKSHSDIKPLAIVNQFICQWCKRWFRNFPNWRAHVESKRCHKSLTITPVETLLDLTCPKCGIECPTMQDLTSHIDEMHLPKYGCKVCGARFYYKHTVKTHMARHLGKYRRRTKSIKKERRVKTRVKVKEESDI